VKVQERQEKFEREIEEALERGEVPTVNRDRQGRITAIVPPVVAPRLSQTEKTDYVTSILPIEGEAPLVCGYGSGVIQLGGQLATFPRQGNQEEATTQIASLPAPAAPPTLVQLQGFLERVAELKEPRRRIDAAYIGEDWNTKGDWVGRYGTRYAMLCAMQAPLSQFVINDPSYRVVGRLGLHPYVDGKTYAQQGLRHWMHRRQWDDPRVLWNPVIGYRRQADIDDNGEVYPMTYEGPDIWLGVRIPAGMHRVSLYFFNKDGHEGHNRVRDYLIDVKRGNQNLLVAEEYPTLVRARVKDFWGGVHKSFLLQGRGDYYFVLRKNNSFNTIVQSVTIDKLTGPPTSYEKRRDVWLGTTRYEAPGAVKLKQIEAAALARVGRAEKPKLQAALSLWNALDGSVTQSGSEVLDLPGRILAYRAIQSAVGQSESGEALLRAWRWKLPIRSATEPQEFEAAMRKGWESYASYNPEAAKAIR
jgi:hypothetical protein